LAYLKQAVAEGRISLTPTDNQMVSQSGGVNFGQSNQIQVSGSAIGTMSLNLPSALEAARLLDLIQPFHPDPLPPQELLPEPGDLPPGSRLPFPRNAIFTGREDDLKALAKNLQNGSHTAATGTGGIGKTQLAVEFCYRYGRFFHGVHWLLANQDLTSEIAACGATMGLEPWPEMLPEQTQTTLNAWRRGGPRLVVLDNVDDVEVVQEWLPRLLNGRILITSRQRDWPPDLGLALLPLDSLPRMESRALLRKLARRLEKVSDDQLDQLSERLGDLPLALDLAGRYLHDRRGLSISGFFDELQKTGGALEHSALQDWTKHNPTQHETNLAATFSLSWERLESEDTRRLFCASGYCASNTPIPWEVYYHFAGNREPAAVDADLGILEDSGLIKLAEAGAVVHPLLAEFARLQDEEAQYRALPKLAQTLIELTSQDVQAGIVGYARLDSIREHALEVLRKLAGKAGWEMCKTLAWAIDDYLDIRGHWEERIQVCEIAVNAAHQLQDLSEKATWMSKLGKSHYLLGNLRQAVEYIEQALAIHREIGDRSGQGKDLGNLGIAYNDLGEARRAIQCFQQALAIHQDIGDRHEEGRDLSNLGIINHDLGEVQRAIEFLQQALAIRQEISDRRGEGADLANLGIAYATLGETRRAIEYYQQALAIDREIGDRRGEVADLGNLGLAHSDLGETQRAIECYQQALAIAREIGDRRNESAFVGNLGMAYADLGETRRAIEHHEQALAIAQEIGDRRLVSYDLTNLGLAYASLGETQPAFNYYEQAMAIVCEIDDRRLEYSILANQGSLYNSLGENKQAIEHFGKAQAIAHEIGDQRGVGIILKDIGTTYRSMGEQEQARQSWKLALDIFIKIESPEADKVSKLLEELDKEQ
jgi:tetratricopeptide (TPR) repeat protein